MNDYRIDVVYGDTSIKDRRLIDLVNYINNYHVRKAVREYLERVCYMEEYDYKKFVTDIINFENGPMQYYERFIPGINESGFKILKKVLVDFANKNAIRADIIKLIDELKV